MRNIKLFGIALLVTFLSIAFEGRSYAIPTLQLDIANGTYDTSTQTIVSNGSSTFTLYAYLIPDRYNLVTDTYYISAAVSPQVGSSDADLGSFTINGAQVNVTSDMTYGVPPLEQIVSLQGWDSGDLPRHGIYPTYFFEQEFSFGSNTITAYNTQDRAITGVIDSVEGTNMYYYAFNIDISLLDPSYVLHFDLYNTKLKRGVDMDVTQFAPFSHDAESSSRQVPEPGTVIMLGSGLVALYLRSRFMKRK